MKSLLQQAVLATLALTVFVPTAAAEHLKSCAELTAGYNYIYLPAPYKTAGKIYENVAYVRGQVDREETTTQDYCVLDSGTIVVGAWRFSLVERRLEAVRRLRRMGYPVYEVVNGQVSLYR